MEIDVVPNGALRTQVAEVQKPQTLATATANEATELTVADAADHVVFLFLLRTASSARHARRQSISRTIYVDVAAFDAGRTSNGFLG